MMNLKEKLGAGQSKELTEAIVAYVGNDASRFRLLMEMVLGKDKQLSQRAAWPMSYIAEAHPKLTEPYVKDLLTRLSEHTHHPAVHRNIWRVFQQTTIEEKYISPLLDLSFACIQKESETVANRAFAITCATRICSPYPELRRELRILLQDVKEKPHAPAISVRLKYALKQLDKIDSKI